MYRIKTLTKSEKNFLSPFVYTKKDAEKRISRFMAWHDAPKYSLVYVESYPKANEYYDGAVSHSNIDNKILEAEIRWKNHRVKDDKKDD